MENGLPVIDYNSGAMASPEAIFRCPTNAIKWVEKNQFEEQEELEIRGERYG
jgi:hypothetical protein